MERNYAAKDISTKQPPPRKEARVSRSNGNKERPRRSEAPTGKGSQAPDCAALLMGSLPKEARLLKRTDFLRVYEEGKRFEGRLMTVFILPAVGPIDRVGVTATKKAIGNKAHDRNRAKRLLREAFRLSRNEFDLRSVKFDWVLNAKRAILKEKLAKVREDLATIAGKVSESGNPEK